MLQFADAELPCRNAYIMTAIYGYNFCSGARKSFTLLTKNAARAVVLDKVTDFVLFIGKVLVVVIVSVPVQPVLSNVLSKRSPGARPPGLRVRNSLVSVGAHASIIAV